MACESFGRLLDTRYKHLYLWSTAHYTTSAHPFTRKYLNNDRWICCIFKCVLPVLAVERLCPSSTTALRTASGAISVQIRLAVALRILAGASYLDVAVMFGLGMPTVYRILWQVIDAINDCPEVGPFLFPQDEASCLRHAEKFKVRRKRRT